MEEEVELPLGQYLLDALLVMTALIVIGHAISNGMKAESTVSAIISVYDTFVVDVLASPIIAAAAIAHIFRVSRLILEETDIPEFIDNYGGSLFQKLNNMLGIFLPREEQKPNIFYKRKVSVLETIKGNLREDGSQTLSNGLSPSCRPALQVKKDSNPHRYKNKRSGPLPSVTATSCKWNVTPSPSLLFIFYAQFKDKTIIMGSDAFLQVPQRWLGYGFAIGEALRYISTYEAVDTLYAIGALFIMLHVINNAIATSKLGAAFIAIYDTLVFDLLASAVIPAIIVAQVCRVTRQILSDTSIPHVIRHYGPTVVGLLCLYLISQPLDDGVQQLMNQSIRKYY